MRVAVLKAVLFALALVPLAWLIRGAWLGDLGANPLETVTHTLGDWALRLLLITLAVTPLRRLSGWNWLVKLRRMLGLYAFFYASLHFMVWVWLDQQLVWVDMLADIVKRPYVTVGFVAWLLLVPLALTSNRFAIRKLGRRWQQLHRLVYVIAPLAVLHFLWLVKADWLEPLTYGAILAVLLGLRYRRGPRKVRPAEAITPY